MSDFKMSIRFKAVEEIDGKQYYVCWGGPADICRNINIDGSLKMIDTLKEIVNQWTSDTYIVDVMYVYTPIRDSELDMTPTAYVEHSDGMTRKEHELHKRGYASQSIGGKLRINFVHNKQKIRDSAKRTVTVHLCNRGEVDEDNRVLTLIF